MLAIDQMDSLMRDRKKKASNKPRRRSRYCSLSPRFDGQPVHLGAFQIAQRVFWAQAIADRDETLDVIYTRVLAVLGISLPEEPHSR